jgi:glycosyltransferase involved in cell wall biosynthesis
MNVLLDLTPLSTPTATHGKGRYIYELARGLCEFSAGVHVTGMSRFSPKQPLHFETLSLELLARHSHEKGMTDKQRRRWALFSLATLLRDREPELLHLPDPVPVPLGRLQGPLVLTCHDLIPLEFPRQYPTSRGLLGVVRRRLHRHAYCKAARVIAISRATADSLVTLGVPSHNIEVVHHGIAASKWTTPDIEQAARVLAKYSLEPARYILCVGELNWRKSIRNVLRALANVNQRVGSGRRLRLVCTGHDIPKRVTMLATLATELGIQADVLHAGYVSDADLLALYANAHSLVFVSAAEGFGYPIVEAMTAGCPVVTSNISSMPEIAGDAGLLVDPNDATVIADAIIELNNDGVRAECIGKGRQRAAHFSFRKQIELTRAIYSAVIDRAR